jgi:hypothetical protein
VTATVSGTCSKCGRARTSEPFCECGALFDYSVPVAAVAEPPPPADAADGKNGADTDAGEWPPGPFDPVHQRPATTGLPAVPVVLCTNEACGAANPEYASFCWKCGTALGRGGEARKRWSLRRTLGLERRPLSAGERKRVRSPLFTGGRLGAALLVVAVVVALAALAVGIDKAWRPAAHGVARGYDVSREALWPQFEPVYPSSVNPPRRPGPIANVRLWRRHVNPLHPPFDAFDRNLSTYWQSATPRQQPDRIRANFKPAAPEIDEVSIYAGDPTGATIVPESIQMTFYRWEAHPRRSAFRALLPKLPPPAVPCPHPLRPPRPYVGPWPSGAYCVTGVVKVITLENTPAVQRFSTGAQRDVSMVVITVRGVHRADNPHAKAALTDVEFFRRH